MECPNPHCEAALPAAAKACPACRLPLPGVLFQGRYAIAGILLRGQHVFRYQATDRDSDETVELCVLITRDAEARSRFLSEVGRLATLEGDGFQKVRTVVESEMPAVVLEAFGDRPSGERAPFSEPELVHIAYQAAKILARLHDRRLLHRGLRPDHLRLNRDLDVTLVGWGFERMLAGHSGQVLERVSDAEQDFIAPEMASRDAVPKSDLFALGMTLMALATGLEPGKLYQPTSKTYRWREHCRLSDPLAELIEAMIEPAIGKRVASAKRVIKRLLPLLPAEEQADAALDERAFEESLLERLGLGGLEFDIDRRWAYPAAVLVFLFPMFAALAPGLPPTWTWSGRTLVDAPSSRPSPAKTPVPLAKQARLIPEPSPSVPLQRRARAGFSAEVAPKTAPTRDPVPSTWTPPDREPSHVEIRISKTHHLLEVYQDSFRLMGFEVGLGASGSTPTGRFLIEDKAEHPDYRRPQGGIIPGGDRRNPLGARWLGLSVQGRHGIGIHGTPYRDSIGDDQSLGCIRMRNEDVETLYNAIPAHTWVSIEP